MPPEPSLRFRLILSGPDRPGITAEALNALAASAARLVDVAQVVVHDHLLLGLVIEVPDAAEKARAFSALGAAASALGLGVQEVALREGESLSDARYAVTAIGRALSVGGVQLLARTLSNHGGNIERIERLSEGPLFQPRPTGTDQGAGVAALELSVSLSDRSREPELKGALLSLSAQAGFDCALQRESLLRRNKRLVVMDMDSTLIRIEVIDELARAYGVGEQVAAITRRAMLGELDYDQSLRERVGLLAGLDASVLQKIAQSLPLTEGAETLLKVLRRLGYKTAILSGGFSVAAQALQARLGIDFAWSNQLEIREGKLTGQVVGPIVNAQRKADLLVELARDLGIPLDQVVAIGDGANDLLMLQKAGHGIAFHGKPKLREAAHTAINEGGLDALLYLLGMSASEVSELPVA